MEVRDPAWSDEHPADEPSMWQHLIGYLCVTLGWEQIKDGVGVSGGGGDSFAERNNEQ